VSLFRLELITKPRYCPVVTLDLLHPAQQIRLEHEVGHGEKVLNTMNTYETLSRVLISLHLSQSLTEERSNEHDCHADVKQYSCEWPGPLRGTWRA